MYYDYKEEIKKIPSHRILAINRGESEDFLKVKLNKPEEKIIYYIEKDIIKGETQFTQILKDTILDSYKRLIEPSVEREIRSDLTEKAEEQAIKVFGENYQNDLNDLSSYFNNSIIQLKHYDIQKYLSSIQHLNTRSIAHHITVINSFYTFLVEENIIKDNKEQYQAHTAYDFLRPGVAFGLLIIAVAETALDVRAGFVFSF